MEPREMRRQREVHSKPKLNLMRPDSTSGASSQTSVIKPSHIQKNITIETQSLLQQFGLCF